MNLNSALLLAQDDGAAAAAAGVGIVMVLVYLAVIILIIVGLWKIFEKAGKPGWAAIVPVYNVIVLLEIVGKPIWWLLLLFVPCVGIVIAIMMYIELAKCFGKDTAYGLGLAFLGPIFIPMLGFGSAQYKAPPPPA